MEPENVVYIVSRVDWDCEKIYAVFSNWESAQKFVDEYVDYYEVESPDAFWIRGWEVRD